MSVFSINADFLPEKTKLMVLIKPKGNFDKTLEKYFIRDLNVKIKRKNIYITVCLDEPLRINFSISKEGNINKTLSNCQCSTSVLPDTKLTSINHAYSRISRLFELNRKSHENNVFKVVFFHDTEDNYWKPLDIQRNKVYKLYEEDFEERKRIIQEKLDTYTKPLSGTIEQLDSQSNIKNEIIKLLEFKNQDLQKQLQELNTLIEKSKLTAYKERLEEFRKRLEQDYPEASGLNSWQEWIYKNNWLFGIQYGTPIGHPQVGFRSILDYLFPTPDGFVDILEIKKPSHEVIKEDKSHSGAFRWSGEVNEAIGQVIRYLSEIELHQLEIAKRLKQELSLELSTIKPRAFILVGRSDNWSDIKKEGFRRLKHSLHGIEVITYTDLLRRGENLIKVYAD